MATPIAPVYSIYVDTRNGYSVGIHKINLIPEQFITTDTFTWDVPRLADALFVGEHLSLEEQLPRLSSLVNGGGDNRNAVDAFIGAATVRSYPKNPNGSVDLIYTTLHQGAISNSNRTA